MHTEELLFAAGGQRLAATKIYPSNGNKPGILALHGLGPTATRHSMRYLLEDLADSGYASMTFEFAGNGDSTGSLDESSLRQRREETLAAAGQLNPDDPPVLIGTSMGAHLAAWCVPELRPRGLVLFCPAAYPAAALDTKFGGRLARPASYPDSPAFDGMREFCGDLLIIGARNDEVVPETVIAEYLASAGGAKSAAVVWLDDCGHFVHRWLPDHKAQRAEVHQAILRVVSANNPNQ